VKIKPPIEDIRNCSAAKKKPLIALSGINKKTKNNELWWLDIETGESKMLVSLRELINYVAISPSGDYICYTAFPINANDSVSMFGYDLENNMPVMLLEGQVNRGCIPSWHTTEKKIFYHTIDNKVMELDIKNKVTQFLFDGCCPFISPDGSLIGFQKQDQLFLWNVSEMSSREIPIKQDFFKGSLNSQMSWSFDGQFISLGRSSSLGYETTFGVVEIITAQYKQVNQKYIKGLQFL